MYLKTFMLSIYNIILISYNIILILHKLTSNIIHKKMADSSKCIREVFNQIILILALKIKNQKRNLFDMSPYLIQIRAKK